MSVQNQEEDLGATAFGRSLAAWDHSVLAGIHCNPLRVTAAFLAVLGWAMIWAQALSLVELVPLWVPLTVFFVGLALIPFGVARTPSAKSSCPR